MTKYEYKQQIKQERKERKERKKFEKLSKTEYKPIHRFIIRIFRIGGPLGAFIYTLFQIYALFWSKIYNNDILQEYKNLKWMFVAIFFGLFLFLWFYPPIMKWIRKARLSNANARNTGSVSYEYSTFFVDFVAVILLAWPLMLLWLFNYVSLKVGQEMGTMFSKIAYAYMIGAFVLLVGSIIQDAILKRIKKRQKKAEHITQMNIYDLNISQKNEDDEN